MDDEDSSNRDSMTGWTGTSFATNDSTFNFCRVDGAQFHPLTTAATRTITMATFIRTCP